MSLLVAFDDINARGNQLIFDYLSSEFPTILLDATKIVDEVNGHPGGKCFFTTYPKLAQDVSSLIKTVLFINDPNEGYSTRGDNISGWRQNMTVFKMMDSVFVASSALATTFLNTYRIPCKVQYPYAPQRNKSTSSYILYNKFPKYMSEMQDFAPHESYMMYEKLEDFQNAKLYVHLPEPGEQWNINIILAHTYGVPCITYQQGCFSEFCTTGDKMLPVGVDSRTWISNFKIALRDHSINSKIVYDMSQRFHTMNELQQRIRQALKNNGMHRTPPTFIEVQEKAAGVDAMKKLQTRRPVQAPVFVQKIVRPPSRRNDWQGIGNYLDSNDRVYAGVGGMGDALLTLSAAHNDPGSKVIFGSNSGVKEPVKQLFDTFQVDVQIVQNFNGSSEGYSTWQSIMEHPNCKGAVHIPPDLNYGDWGSNAKEYLSKTPKRMPFENLVGKLINPRATKKVIGLCPRGSDHTSVWKQRYLSRDEFHRLTKKLLGEDATVVVFGSAEDLAYYGVYQDNNVLFMNSNFAVSHPAPKYPITMRHMLTAVNSCDYIVSVDTWLKTYAALAGIPCKVIMNRYFGKSTLEYADPSDKIFLDSLFWGFDVVPLESLF